tara:strand:+ start:355 stop:621 length:267 start_codon:yes stop_codon:yes gene_type:complete
LVKLFLIGFGFPFLAARCDFEAAVLILGIELLFGCAFALFGCPVLLVEDGPQFLLFQEEVAVGISKLWKTLHSFFYFDGLLFLVFSRF